MGVLGNCWESVKRGSYISKVSTPRGSTRSPYSAEPPAIWPEWTNNIGYVVLVTSGVARTFPGGQAAYPEDQNEEENEENLREKWGKV